MATGTADVDMTMEVDCSQAEPEELQGMDVDVPGAIECINPDTSSLNQNIAANMESCPTIEMLSQETMEALEQCNENHQPATVVNLPMYEGEACTGSRAIPEVVKTSSDTISCTASVAASESETVHAHGVDVVDAPAPTQIATDAALVDSHPPQIPDSLPPQVPVSATTKFGDLVENENLSTNVKLESEPESIKEDVISDENDKVASATSDVAESAQAHDHPIASSAVGSKDADNENNNARQDAVPLVAVEAEETTEEVYSTLAKPHAAEDNDASLSDDQQEPVGKRESQKSSALEAQSKSADSDDGIIIVDDDPEAADTGKPTKRSRKLKPNTTLPEFKDHEQLAWENEPLCGFAFNEQGQLRDKNGNSFVFEVSSNHRRNQERYERLGEAVTDEIYRLLEDRCKLTRIYLPLGVDDDEDTSGESSAAKSAESAAKSADTSDCKDGHAEPQSNKEPDAANGTTPALAEPTVSPDHVKCSKVRLPPNKPHSFVFVSDNWKSASRLLILIHGSGVVRAGQWARRLIINDDLDKGTQMPYIERALAEGYGVIVLNTNLNSWPDTSHGEPIPENDSPEAHVVYVWRELVMKQASAPDIAIVAHSYGGMVTRHLVFEELEACQKRIFGVGFTDSVHGFGYVSRERDSASVKEVRNFFAERTRNWVTSDLALDTPLSSNRQAADSSRVSAGHIKHEWTSCSCMDSVFKYLNELYTKRHSTHSDDNDSPDLPSSSL